MNLADFDDSFERQPVAYAFELARFSVFEDSDAPNRKITDWSVKVSESPPDEDDWDQTPPIEHRIRNVTPLAEAPKDTNHATAYKYTYSGHQGPTTTIGTDDPRGSDQLLRCTPLKPLEETKP